MAKQPIIIVGLGNPGDRYRYTRHNIGFLTIETLASLHNAIGFSKKFNSYISEVNINSTKAILVKPATYMNLSGIAIAEIIRFYKLSLDSLLVIHDDLDLMPFQLRYKKGGGNGGHNGLKSIDSHFGQNYKRLKIGIGRPEHKEEVANYVLSNFSKTEQNYLSDFLPKLVQIMPELLTSDAPNEILNKLNLSDKL
ncbi:aminoacyl-tRNA hydrolase [Bartonella sp. TP]|uniref:aminoacyl-tRNA hydrolase n=1 Tax=Bartonella sp. TP TaxID=3057550 RepID=UPI0025B1BD43|nr:aminoacyl-tRNA hydrolase [Bartonella sp. TP]MDN5249515.1 aminoacyl-tRNA hydrolase [Alphaproteobacteria bacterium]WJW79719.1 aminoacyl-tRNA hydrolase [Bartonella sp. TP]